jgi:excisionase family DNA binding protein
MANDDQKLADSIEEFAKRSGLGRSFLYEQIKAGLLPVRKAGRRSLILREEGRAYLASLPRANPQPTSPSD